MDLGSCSSILRTHNTVAAPSLCHRSPVMAVRPGAKWSRCSWTSAKSRMYSEVKWVSAAPDGAADGETCAAEGAAAAAAAAGGTPAVTTAAAACPRRPLLSHGALIAVCLHARRTGRRPSRGSARRPAGLRGRTAAAADGQVNCMAGKARQMVARWRQERAAALRVVRQPLCSQRRRRAAAMNL